MARAPLQVLIFPYRRRPDGRLEYAVFRRADGEGDLWQGVSGGAEDDETAEAAARRELAEETGLSAQSELVALDAQASIPATVWRDRHGWSGEILVVLERAFGARAPEGPLALSGEHLEHRWLPFEAARDLLRWDSNRTALWELNERLTRPRP